ncbi:MAG: hypothetical protein N3A66_03850, partial [Planctomycetota bacterium]|nr:hypothetical protein [Planctomycetota bacterium]
ELVILSDFQRSSWGEKNAASRQQAREALRRLAVPPRLTLFRVGKEARDNVVVEPLDLSRQVLGVGQRLRVRANVRNRGDADYPNLRVFFRADGKEVSAAQIALPPRQERQVLFSHVFAQPGSHVLEVEAEADTLRADNRSLASVVVWDKLPALLFNGEPAATPLKTETGFLALALWPFGAVQAPQPDLIAPTVVDGVGWDPKVLGRYRVAVAANVQRFQEEQAKALEQFVRDGGDLLIFLGDRIDRQWWNNRLVSLLPGRIGEMRGGRGEADTAVAVQHFSHPALAMFNDPREGRLDSGRIRLWYQAEPLPAEPPVSLVARLQNGDPFLLERRCGAGRVIMCATACDADWNDLPLEPSYVPLMQQLVAYLGSTIYPPRNVEIGEKLAAFLPAEEAGKIAILTDPSGKQRDLPVRQIENRALVEYGETSMPGLYILRSPSGETAHFVVRTPLAESDLALLSEAEFKRLAEALNADAVSSAEEYRALQQQRRYGIELWQPLLGLVAALLLLEIWLAGRFAERSA